MVVINVSDSENVRKSKRIANLEEQKQAHILGAMEPLTVSQRATIRAGIERAKAQPRAWDYKLSDTAYTNGMLWIRYKNGANKYEYHMGFSGRARAEKEINWGEARPTGRFNIGNPNR